MKAPPSPPTLHVVIDFDVEAEEAYLMHVGQMRELEEKGKKAHRKRMWNGGCGEMEWLCFMPALQMT